MPIKLIVGLGNPGPEYEDTRHNAGFWLLDQLAQQWHSHWQDDRNLSGHSVQAVASFYKIQPQEILVIHDELDLEPGRIKFKLGGGNGGHNGLKDIQARLGSPDFYRLRLGIGHPGDRNEVVNYVLKKPRREEKELIEDAIDKSIATLPDLLAGKIEAAQRVLHGK